MRRRIFVWNCVYSKNTLSLYDIKFHLPTQNWFPLVANWCKNEISINLILSVRSQFSLTFAEFVLSLVVSYSRTIQILLQFVSILYISFSKTFKSSCTGFLQDLYGGISKIMGCEESVGTIARDTGWPQFETFFVLYLPFRWCYGCPEQLSAFDGEWHSLDKEEETNFLHILLEAKKVYSFQVRISSAVQKQMNTLIWLETYAFL